jgi:hypothetical protein
MPLTGRAGLTRATLFDRPKFLPPYLLLFPFTRSAPCTRPAGSASPPRCSPARAGSLFGCPPRSSASSCARWGARTLRWFGLVWFEVHDGRPNSSTHHTHPPLHHHGPPRIIHIPLPSLWTVGSEWARLTHRGRRGARSSAPRRRPCPSLTPARRPPRS